MITINPKSLAILIFSLFSLTVFAQRIDNSTWKAQVALGVAMPSQSGFIDQAPAKSVNFPSVNLGLQRMFSKVLGAKLDYGFNRLSNDDGSPEFKVNYSRVNAQLVYDPSQSLTFLPEAIQVVLHSGPGFSFLKPLGGLDTNQSYFNFNLGTEIHYRLNRKISVYTDLSYIYGFTSLDDYDPQISGLGAFNGNIFNLTFGVSISLSDCFYCE